MFDGEEFVGVMVTNKVHGQRPVDHAHPRWQGRNAVGCREDPRWDNADATRTLSLRSELEDLDQVEDAFVYGSWAQRYAGQDGPQPRDVDVLVLVRPDTDPVPVYQACARVTDLTGETINPTVLTAEEWDREDSAFSSNLREQSRVGVLGDGYGKVRP